MTLADLLQGRIRPPGAMPIGAAGGGMSRAPATEFRAQQPPWQYQDDFVGMLNRQSQGERPLQPPSPLQQRIQEELRGRYQDSPPPQPPARLGAPPSAQPEQGQWFEPFTQLLPPQARTPMYNDMQPWLAPPFMPGPF